MNRNYLKGRQKIFFFPILALLFLCSFPKASCADSDKGKIIFAANCASCHRIMVDATGPFLFGKENEVPGGRKWIYNWVHNPQAILQGGDKYALGLQAKFSIVMPSFPQLTDQDINDVLDYVKVAGELAQKSTPANQPAGSTQPTGSDNSLLYGLLTLVLAIMALILMQINSNLSRLASEKQGETVVEPIPIYRNKGYIAIVSVVLFLVAGYFLTDAAVHLGRQQNYEPTQPIFFSHHVHAGLNQINCLYCHAGAEKSKQAMIPSPNICMNCHTSISGYSGPTLTDFNGKTIDGTTEIHKLYDYIGWDQTQKKYTRPGRPIAWVKIHNLPDFVYFNHSQHVVVGKVQCQTCHGPITDENQVYQYANLSMGWCINCHRTTKVQF
ncbi:MAG TPA: c-type cytochrome, partial [Chitinophagaceae bacterium]|nr:c-type cytochrome [Chitinophagaceae bacterium]